MSQTKKECMEYIIVILDDMKSEVKKLMHKDNYQTYDREFLNVDYLEEAIEELDDEVDRLKKMFEDSIPEETKIIRGLEVSNEALREYATALTEQIKTLEAKLEFSLILKDDLTCQE